MVKLSHSCANLLFKLLSSEENTMTRSIQITEPAQPLFPDESYGEGFFRDGFDNLLCKHDEEWYLLLDE
jgi:hypothetical protein